MNQNELLRTVAGTTGLTRRGAEDVVVGTLTVLAEVVSADETRDLLAQLPKAFRERIPVSGETVAMRPIEFVARVAELTTTPVEDTEAHVGAVFEVLTQAVNAGEMNDIASELGDEYAPLLGREERLRREQATASTSEPGLVAGVVGAAVGGAAAALHSLVSTVWRPIDAGLRIGGLRD